MMDSEHYFNPYSGKNFFGVLFELLMRLANFLIGNLSIHELATDEIQVLVLIGVASSAAMVGTFLVLRKMTMLANSLSHTILIGIVIAFLFTKDSMIAMPGHGYALNVPVLLMASFLMGILTTFLTELLTKGARLQEDASIGLVFTSLFAVGIIAVSVLTKNMHVGIEAVMGNVDALQLEDCKLVYIVMGVNILFFVLFFKEFTITTFDPGLSLAFGITPTFFNYLLMSQTSATTIGAFRAVGVLMLLAFITAPALTARLLTHDLKKMIFIAIAIGCTASIFGVALARHVLTVYGTSLSTSGLVVSVLLLFFIIAVCWKKTNPGKNKMQETV
jgi:manganese/zinc/iron transport system permease protein